MNWKNVLKPTLIKIITVIVILLVLYFYLLFNIRVNYVCLIGGEECEKQTQDIIQKLALQDTLILGIPLSIIAWIIIGLIEVNKNKSSKIKSRRKQK